MINIENATIINLTPHDVVIYDTETNDILRTIPASGEIARVEQYTKQLGSINGIPLTVNRYGTIIGLPEFRTDTYYVVSGIVANISCRGDLLVPNESIRDDKGRVIGCKSLATVIPPSLVLDCLGEMTVKQLIDVLQQCDPNDQIFFKNDEEDEDESYFYRLNCIRQQPKSTVLFILE